MTTLPTDAAELDAGVSVVVPVFNSEQTLPQLVEQLTQLFNSRGQAGEIILVNDCSRDRSWEVIRELSAKNRQVRGFDLMRNFGQHNALLCGIRCARHEIIVTMDDDLQHPPEEVPKLLERLAEGYDVVYGAPKDLPHGLLRNVASSITKLALQTTMGAETARRAGAFRAFRTKVRRAFDDFRGSFVSIDVLLTWGTNRFSHVLVRHEPRKIGQTNYTFGKLVTHAVNMITGFSTLPLQIASIIGLVLTVFGAGLLVLVLARYFFGDNAPAGFPFLAAVITIFSGAQLFSLGIIGEYLARIHFRLLDRPSYVLRSGVAAEKRGDV